MRRGAPLVAGLVALLGAVPAPAQEARLPERGPSVLVIDREAVLVESRTGRERLADLAAAEGELAAENRRIEADLTAEEADLAARRAGMDPGAFREAADAFDQRVTTIRQTQDAKERVLIERRQRLLELFRQDMLPILGALMEERRAEVMVDRGSVLIFAATADVTEEVIRRIDAATDAAAKEAEGDPSDDPPAAADAPATPLTDGATVPDADAPEGAAATPGPAAGDAPAD